MRMMTLCAPILRRCLILISASLITYVGFTQTVSDKDLIASGKKLDALQKNIDAQTQQLLTRMEKKETRLLRQVQSTDSNRSRQLFPDIKAQYQRLRQSTPSADPGMAEKLKTYLPGMDSVQTALKFLQQSSLSLEKIGAFSAQLQQAQSKLQDAAAIQTWLKDRESLLQQQLANNKFTGQLTALNKERYYYQQRVAQYRAALNDKDKIQQALLTRAAAQPAFQKFFQQHSMLATMFPINAGDEPVTDSSLAGLQTRAQVGKLIAEKLGKAPPASGATNPAGASTKINNDGQGYLAQQVQSAKDQLDVLKNKARQLGLNGSSSDIVMPNFAPNDQKTKPFLKRLEYGFNIQNTGGSSYLPAISNIALMLGYKLSDKITVGAGISYLLGWGHPVKDIHFNSQGVGLRSFIDTKIKGTFWATGGFEYNYINAFSGIAALKDPDRWQKSALFGLTKKYRLGNKTANLQLLYDVLAARQVPAMSPLKFRIGYSF